ncbi:hypothetical protein FN846DRAFT_698302 [Sphaerosporella brunnea]|uniref:Uncharacterized protein n=1 Tax=Sphaerosporella brunnea TaxID=1250544 RepID=A0A5J5EXX0_9PEZI|nr:hypothetical protein FN846DRAFT_698302 [Sphaerosporella brunnea]
MSRAVRLRGRHSNLIVPDRCKLVTFVSATNNKPFSRVSVLQTSHQPPTHPPCCGRHFHRITNRGRQRRLEHNEKRGQTQTEPTTYPSLASPNRLANPPGHFPFPTNNPFFHPPKKETHKRRGRESPAYRPCCPSLSGNTARRPSTQHSQPSASSTIGAFAGPAAFRVQRAKMNPSGTADESSSTSDSLEEGELSEPQSRDSMVSRNSVNESGDDGTRVIERSPRVPNPDRIRARTVCSR